MSTKPQSVVSLIRFVYAVYVGILQASGHFGEGWDFYARLVHGAFFVMTDGMENVATKNETMHTHG